jgi:hypothetical protein
MLATGAAGFASRRAGDDAELGAGAGAKHAPGSGAGASAVAGGQPRGDLVVAAALELAHHERLSLPVLVSDRVQPSPEAVYGGAGGERPVRLEQGLLDRLVGVGVTKQLGAMADQRAAIPVHDRLERGLGSASS